MRCCVRPSQKASTAHAAANGIATLASAFRDPDFIRQEVDLLDAWLQPYIR